MLTRMLLPFGMRLIVQTATAAADRTEREQTLKSKPNFCLYAACPFVFFCLMVCGQQVFKLFEFQNNHSKIFEIFCLLPLSG
jgi:hypothetical protein